MGTRIDADEALDPVEASDYKKVARRPASEPEECLGFACPEKSDTCGSDCTIAMKELIRGMGREGVEPVVSTLKCEPRRWFYSNPDVITGPTNAKQYVLSSAPPARGGHLSAILQRMPRR